jgi:tRNA G18 (ribose-2'-O)-methylase SpoU
MMAIQRITVPNDPRVVLYGSVSDPELARWRGLFVAEGRLVVRRVLENPRYRVQSLLLNDAAYRDLAPLIDRAPPGTEVLLCETGTFLGITGINIHRGCLALVERPPAVALNELIAGVDRLIVLDGVSNADNVGGIFRNAAAFDVGGVLLGPGCCDPLYRKAIRTSMGAVLRVPFTRTDDWPAAFEALHAAGFTTVALTPREPSEPLCEFASRGKGLRVALVLGAEGAGLVPGVEMAADVSVRIPMAEGIDSLNVAVAAGIALYALR